MSRRDWITQRCHQTGGNLNPRPSKQRKGVLRKIVCLKYPDMDYGMFDRPIVILECGHEVRSDGQFKARCSECAKAPIKEEGVNNPNENQPELSQAGTISR